MARTPAGCSSGHPGGCRNLFFNDLLLCAFSAPYQEAAQFLPKGCSRKMPPSFLNLNGVVCSNTLFSNTSALTSSLLFWGNSTGKILEHLVWSNTSGFQFWGPLARTNFLSVLCGLPTLVECYDGRLQTFPRGSPCNHLIRANRASSGGFRPMSRLCR